MANISILNILTLATTEIRRETLTTPPRSDKNNVMRTFSLLASVATQDLQFIIKLQIGITQYKVFFFSFFLNHLIFDEQKNIWRTDIMCGNSERGKGSKGSWIMHLYFLLS